MKFLEDFSVSRSEFGYHLEIRLARGWKDAAQRFPRDKIDEIYANEIATVQRVLDDSGLKQKVELVAGEFGLHHINLSPDRAGLDLFPDQGGYISHNLTRASQPAALLLIIAKYIHDLGLV